MTPLLHRLDTIFEVVVFWGSIGASSYFFKVGRKKAGWISFACIIVLPVIVGLFFASFSATDSSVAETTATETSARPATDSQFVREALTPPIKTAVVVSPPPLRCKTDECMFKGTCTPKLTNSHCVQNDPTNAWLCDTGYVLQNKLCKEVGLMLTMCKMERGDGSYFTGEIAINDLVTCGCKNGYHFAISEDSYASAWCVEDHDFGSLEPLAVCGALTLLQQPGAPPRHISYPYCPPDYHFSRPPIKYTVTKVVY